MVKFEKQHEWYYMIWLALANSFCMDFVARKKVSLNMTYSIMDSLPFPRLSIEDPIVRKLVPLALRLSCGGPEMTTYWDSMAEQGWVDPIAEGGTPPGFVDPEGRLDARTQIDAIVARKIFGLSRDEVDYILETFPIVKEADIARYGDYRTKLLILEQYDSMNSAPASSG